MPVFTLHCQIKTIQKNGLDRMMASIGKWLKKRWWLIVLFLLVAGIAFVCTKLCTNAQAAAPAVQSNITPEPTSGNETVRLPATTPLQITRDNSRKSVSIEKPDNIPQKATTPVKVKEDIPPTPGPAVTEIKPTVVMTKDCLLLSDSPDWYATGLVLKPGQKVFVTQLAGSWTVDRAAYPRVDGNGHLDDGETGLMHYTQSKVLPTAHFGAIIGKMGLNRSDTDAFLLGINRVVTVTQAGELCLRINDKDEALGDNSGSLRVRITVTEEAGQ
jgi:hypothetical protein